MKKVLIILFVFSFAFSQCNKDESAKDAFEVFEETLKSTPYVELSIFPDWLNQKIEEIEADDTPVGIIRVKIFQGEWNMKTVYYVSNNLNSCMFAKSFMKMEPESL